MVRVRGGSLVVTEYRICPQVQKTLLLSQWREFFMSMRARSALSLNRFSHAFGYDIVVSHQ